MEHMHLVAETLRAQRITLPIDGALRRVSRKLRGTIVDWNPVDHMYTVDIDGIGAVRLRPDELRITNIQDVDPPNFVAASRERVGFRARLAAAMAAENAVELPMDPEDLLPYRGQGRRGGEPAIAMGVPVFGPFLGVLASVGAARPFMQALAVGQALA